MVALLHFSGDRDHHKDKLSQNRAIENRSNWENSSQDWSRLNRSSQGKSEQVKSARSSEDWSSWDRSIQERSSQKKSSRDMLTSKQFKS